MIFFRTKKKRFEQIKRAMVLWLKLNNFQIQLMATSGYSVPQANFQNDNLSKREQKKLEQALKLIEATENPQIKNHKRRKPKDDKVSDPQARKLIKTESLVSDAKNKDAGSSAKQFSEQDSKVNSLPQKKEIKELSSAYNLKYGIPQGTISFSEYMVNYTYGEKSKAYDKQDQDWTKIMDLGGDSFNIVVNEKDQAAGKKISQKFQQNKQKLQDPFSKNCKQFVKKYVNKEFMISDP